MTTYNDEWEDQAANGGWDGEGALKDGDKHEENPRSGFGFGNLSRGFKDKNEGGGEFGGNQRGFGRRGENENSTGGGFRRRQNDDDNGGFRRGGGGGFRGGRTGENRGFGRDQDNGDDRNGIKRGFRGGRGDEDGENSGFGGGFRNSRGRGGRSDEDGENSGFGGGFRNSRGRGGRSDEDRENSGFGGGFRNSRGRGGRSDDDGENSGFGGGFRNSRGRGGRSDGDGGGFGSSRGGYGENREFGGSSRRGGEDEADSDRPRVEHYIPPEGTEDESIMFSSGITSGINFDTQDKIDVKVTGSNAPSPIREFEDANLRSILLENVKKSGYKKPTPVQKNSIPIIISGRDLMACAQTGSGKTASFLVPIMHKLLSEAINCVVTPEGACLPQCIIISPTRELTNQIFEEARKFSHSSLIKCCVMYGGTSTQDSMGKLMRGCHILVATPGRLHDMVNRGKISFDHVRFVVLDEADRMLDMGFLPDIEKMINHPSMPKTGKRQTLMFSATFPTDIQRLAAKFLNDYLFVAVGVVGGANNDVEQSLHQVPKFQKRAKLQELLAQEAEKKAMVFVETKRTADFIAAFLSENGFPSTSIHGDRLQKEREEALRDFRCGRMRILVATAVAARGLDIKNVEHVVNYDLPKTIDEYVHRIGRTGRVGNRGLATSLYDPEFDRDIATELLKCLAQAQQNIPEWLQQQAQGGSFSSGQQNSFGGSDFRKREASGSAGYTAPAPVEPDEEW